jgi:hypothetical protein
MYSKKKLWTFILATILFVYSLSVCTFWQNINDTLLYILLIVVGLYDLGKDN